MSMDTSICFFFLNIDTEIVIMVSNHKLVTSSQVCLLVFELLDYKTVNLSWNFRTLGGDDKITTESSKV